MPYLIAEAMASNIGSVMRITGNPQNMLIGMMPGISYIDFFLYLSLISFLLTIVLIFVVYLIYKKDFDEGEFKIDYSLEAYNFNFKSIRFSLLIFMFTISLFFLSSPIKLEIPIIALVGATLILLFGGVKPSKIIGKVNWVLLLFFAGLFVVIGGFKGRSFRFIVKWIKFSPNVEGIISLNFFSTIISQIVSNVPLTMLIISLIKDTKSNLLWISLAAGSTLGGNAILIGVVANLIVIKEADKKGVKISFKEFTRTGVIVTTLTILISILILTVEHELGFLV